MTKLLKTYCPAVPRRGPEAGALLNTKFISSAWVWISSGQQDGAAFLIFVFVIDLLLIIFSGYIDRGKRKLQSGHDLKMKIVFKIFNSKMIYCSFLKSV
ncbi:MAG: hypothetical protein CVV30_05610 [Methanomicrobiales archaeon HGW-Methanomicrobiales-1]|jgi:uncharacterized membrane protein|nr:MAG: hypothetical protein CVV30_05610 [Methanomicrobiales archaeon HGW-Methanomicrobiales-1]